MDIEQQQGNGVLNDKNRYSYYLCFLYYLYVCNGWFCMNKLELEQNKYINTLYSIVDKLEKRIATLEKVLASHAKCIGQIREVIKDE